MASCSSSNSTAATTTTSHFPTISLQITDVDGDDVSLASLTGGDVGTTTGSRFDSLEIEGGGDDEKNPGDGAVEAVWMTSSSSSQLQRMNHVTHQQHRQRIHVSYRYHTVLT